MDSIFGGYLPKTNDEITDIIVNGNIVFDSSSLFNLYRYQKETSEQIIKYLEKIKDRIFLPYMVGLEYHNNRTTILSQQRAIYPKLNQKVSQLKKSIADQFLNEQHSTVSFEDINIIVSKFEANIQSYLRSCEKSHPNYLINDPIREKLVHIFKNKTGKALSKQELNELYTKAEERFSCKIPPGYKDAKNKENIVKNYGSLQIKSKYADYIIWHEIIEFGKKTNNSTLLICDERKEDWCWEEQGYNLGPRPELTTEYKVSTGKKFHMLNLLSFFNKLKELDILNISDKAILDIKSTSNISWKDEVINAFKMLGGTASLNQIYNYIEKYTSKKLTKEWKGTVRKSIYYYCDERDLFIGKDNLYRSLSDSRYQLIRL